jgi:glycosyltransferase involved in cell wall biosynthesis
LSATDPAAILVIIPALNEERAIRDVVASVLAECPNVLVIDDGSTDATVARLEGLAVDVIRHAQPLGKGECLREGFREALRRGFDAVVTMDGDGQHVAADIPRLLVAARAHPEHIVIGARLLGRENQPAARARANAVADRGI